MGTTPSTYHSPISIMLVNQEFAVPHIPMPLLFAATCGAFEKQTIVPPLAQQLINNHFSADGKLR